MNIRYYTNQIVMFVMIAILYALSKGKFNPELRYAWKNRNGYETAWNTLSAVAQLLGLSRMAKFCQKKSDEDWQEYVLTRK